MKKVRLGLIALAVMVSVSAAFATKSNVHAGDTEYAVTGTDGSNYIVTTDISGPCNLSDDACKVLSAATPTDNEIPMSGATVVENGVYQAP